LGHVPHRAVGFARFSSPNQEKDKKCRRPFGTAAQVSAGVPKIVETPQSFWPFKHRRTGKVAARLRLSRARRELETAEWDALARRRFVPVCRLTRLQSPSEDK
jgi:hypothetical protein